MYEVCCVSCRPVDGDVVVGSINGVVRVPDIVVDDAEDICEWNGSMISGGGGVVSITSTITSLLLLEEVLMFCIKLEIFTQVVVVSFDSNETARGLRNFEFVLLLLVQLLQSVNKLFDFFWRKLFERCC